MEIKYLRILQVPLISLNSDTFLKKKRNTGNNPYFTEVTIDAEPEPLTISQHKSTEDSAKWK